MIESVEKGLDVGVYHPRPARPHRIPHGLQGVVGAALRAEPEATGQEVGLHDRLNDDLEGLLDHPIPHAGNTQRAHLPRLTRFRDPDPSHRLRTVSPVPQTDRHLVEETLDTSGLDVGDGDGVDAGGTPVGAHLQPRAPENVHAVDPVEQRVETTIRRPLGRRVQLVLQGPSAVKGVVGPPGHAPTPPSHHKHRRSRGPSLRRVMLSTPITANTTPSDDLPTRCDFPDDGYTHRQLPGRKPGAG